MSIVVPAYNVAPYIDELIESVVCQWDEQVELIIVNDGSTDELQTLLAHYEMTLNTKNFVVLIKRMVVRLLLEMKALSAPEVSIFSF